MRTEGPDIFFGQFSRFSQISSGLGCQTAAGCSLGRALQTGAGQPGSGRGNIRIEMGGQAAAEIAYLDRFFVAGLAGKKNFAVMA